ncbi:putative disease resistance protein At4g11170 isoform X2 [Ipomoea triloba]|uniref:putative disease resistance protein At4g11170 isoform X2 n=1 Tax=Ipomoea triloba TaxID=35885 RepID=UPI00125D99FB|nr:putative disease resistance protein At4g11170 isoform X2 [Ipomoea triloba]
MASSSSSSSRSHSKYAVFLSFMGETRRSFSDHLYTSLWEAGVATFRDEEEIRKGNEISDELKQAIIEGSEISIVVFSKNYAQSRGCLDELVKMVECKQKLGQKILPIFYHVTPSEVRKQTGEFGIALNQHIEQFGEETVNGWKAALTTVADLSEWDLEITKDGGIETLSDGCLLTKNMIWVEKLFEWNPQESLANAVDSILCIHFFYLKCTGTVMDNCASFHPQGVSCNLINLNYNW